MSVQIFKKLLVLVVLFISGYAGFAQETTSDIQGLISDGKVGVGGATITVVNEPTGTKYVTTSRKDGRYNAPNLRVGGPYTIIVSSIGYKEQKQEDIYLVLGEEFTAGFTLIPEAKELSSVTVSSSKQNKIFNNAHTGSQELISRDQIEKLPTINRSIADYTKLEPTANNTSFGVSFGGRSAQYNNITVNGANFNNGFGLSSTLGGQTGAQPISLEAIDQIQVNVSPYDVKQGGFSGAGVNAITKSGTNKFKGSVYLYKKGAGTEGYNVEDVTVPKTPINFYTFGATLGGPIIKNKLFFFVNYEEVKQSVPAFPYVASGGPQHLTATSGSISAASADTLNALIDTLKNHFGYDPGSYQGYPLVSSSKKINARIDWNITPKNTLTFTYDYLRSSAQSLESSSRSGGGFTKPTFSVGNFDNGLPFSRSGYYINNNFDIFLAELNTRFNSQWSNKFQIGYTRERDPRSPGSSVFPMVDILNGLPSTPNTYGAQVFTSFGFETFTYNNLINTDVYQLSDIATYYKGSHEITFGTQDYSRKYADAFAPNYAGGYQFPSLDAFYNTINNIGTPVDHYFQEWSNIPGGAFPTYYAGSTELGFFAQDKWRATPTFTLTYGLRYDMTIYKSLFLDNPFFDALTFKGGTSYNIGKVPGNAILLSPRVGFNWDVKGDRTLQVRGGLGTFSGPPPFVWLANQGGNNGVLLASTSGGVVSNVPFETNVITTPPTGPGTTNPPTTTQSATSYGAAVTANNFKYPSVIKMSLAADQKFGNDWVATIEGTFSKDINAVYYSNANLNESNAFPLAGADNRLRYLTGISTSNKYYFGSTQANPGLSSVIIMNNSSKGYAYTLTGRIQKTIRNFYFSVAYTYTEDKNIAPGGSTAGSLWSGRPVGNADPNAPNLGYADYYQPSRIIAFASYKFEYAKHFATSVGAIFEAAPSGVGSYTYGNDLNGDGNNGNDLMYIPRSASEINLVKAGSGGLGTGVSTDPRTPLQIWNQLNNFINQDHYLSMHRGQYVEANAIVFPFFKHLDMNVTQDIYFYTKGEGGTTDKHTLRIECDLINVGNFLNRNWGLAKQQTTSSPLTFEGMAADGKTPSFSFPYLDAKNQVPLVNSFSNNAGIFSRWQMQIGIKYLFN
jgi:outer membrane receptor for ferrienterochelin and colicin